MSARLLHRAFGVRSYSLVKTSFEDAAAHFHLRKKRSHQRCVACGSREVIHDGHREVVVRSLPIGRRPVWLHLHLATLCCRACGTRRQEARDIADPRKSFTRALARYVVGLCEQMTMSAVAKWLGMSWGTVKSILQEHLERKVARRSWR
ncbi:MAG: transposase family protein, partial [Alphaproteobacteria bacterium]|nr:transposase family protein [Alphaproteobacteria bacterium]